MEGHKPIHQVVEKISAARFFIKKILNIGPKHNEI
jgi:hypothetical protein